jgi:dihydroflavonol-4-reductase
VKRQWIVTGANGFLGCNIIRALTRDPDNQVRALLLPGDPPAALEGLPCEIYRGDVTQRDSLNALFHTDGPCAQLYVVHCAGVVHIGSRRRHAVYQVNVNGTQHIIDAALEHGARLAYVSSVHAIPEKPAGQVMAEVDAFSPDRVVGQYAKTKAQAADCVLRAVRERGLQACILHPSGMLGPYDFSGSHLTQLIRDFANGKLKACVRGGYDFVDVRDVAEGTIRACLTGRAGECYILSNQYMSVRALLDLVSRASGTKPLRLVLPMWLAKGTAPLSELYYALLKQPPLYTAYSLYTLTSNSNFTWEKARRELDYHPRPMEETVRDTVAWLLQTGRIGA